MRGPNHPKGEALLVLTYLLWAVKGRRVMKGRRVRSIILMFMKQQDTRLDHNLGATFWGHKIQEKSFILYSQILYYDCLTLMILMI
jgi:hypothetical protein